MVSEPEVKLCQPIVDTTGRDVAAIDDHMPNGTGVSGQVLASMAYAACVAKVLAPVAPLHRKHFQHQVTTKQGVK